MHMPRTTLLHRHLAIQKTQKYLLKGQESPLQLINLSPVSFHYLNHIIKIGRVSRMCTFVFLNCFSLPVRAVVYAFHASQNGFPSTVLQEPVDELHFSFL